MYINSFQCHYVSCLSGAKFGLTTTAELIIKEIMRNVVSNADNLTIKDSFLQCWKKPNEVTFRMCMKEKFY